MLSKDEIIQQIASGRPLVEIIREFASEVLTEAMVIEAKRFIDERQEPLEDGRRRLVLHGTQKQRDILFPFGVVPVKAPRVLDRGGGDETIAFSSKTIPRFLKRSGEITELIPWMYLKGISESDFQSVFRVIFGQEVPGLSSSTVNRLMGTWSEELSAWDSRDMTGEKYAYVWADGVYFKVRGEKDNVCQLMLLGVGEDGRKRLMGMGEGYAESSDSWRELLLKLRAQGMEAPKLVVGDGGLGLWSGLGKVFPDCGRQFCWVHKLRDVRMYLPKSRHVEVTRKVRDIYMSETRVEASRKIATIAKSLGVKHRQAAETLTKWEDELLGFYDFPAEHWQQIRTTNPIESMFSSIRLRTNKTRGRLGRQKLSALILKLAQTATDNMNVIAHSDKIKLLLDGTIFMDGELVRKYI